MEEPFPGVPWIHLSDPSDGALDLLAQREAGEQELLSEEHFTVDGTLLEAWASQKSFQRKDAPEGPPPEDPGNPTVDFHKEKRTNETHRRRQTRTLGWPGRAKARRPS